MEQQQFIQQLQQAIQNVFPQSLVEVALRGFSTHKDIHITFTLGKDKSEYPMNIINNDKAHWGIWVNKLPGNMYEVEGRSASSFYVTPNKEYPKEKYLAFGSVKTGWKNFKSHTEEEVINKLVKFFIKAKQVMVENKERMTPDFKKLGETKGYW